MNTKQPKKERIHSLDALRAIMMLLGLVLHSALTYNVTYHGDAWSLKDPYTTHLFSDFLVLLIHSFRMPIFFVVAGFFGAMLFYERHPLKMIKNRILRIFLPFVVFLFLLWPIIVFSYSYTNATFSFHQNPFEKALNSFTNISDFIPKDTSHLWFLYYLSLITVTTIVIGLLLKNVKNLTEQIKRISYWLIKKPLARIVYFSGLIFLILTLLGTSMIQTSVSLIPDRNTFVYFFVFYLMGWLLFKAKQHLNTFMRYDWLCTITAIILAIVQGLIIQEFELKPNSNSTLLILFSSVIVCLFIFGVTGLFIRYTSEYSPRMRYISDSSYWVYLIHLPLTALIPAFVWDLPLPAIVKFLIVLLGTTGICFLSYHYLVRNTFIGKFLNGRKYPRKNQLLKQKINVKPKSF